MVTAVRAGWVRSAKAMAVQGGGALLMGEFGDEMVEEDKPRDLSVAAWKAKWPNWCRSCNGWGALDTGGPDVLLAPIEH